jgi:two-component system chemotaxis response regulator CheY
MIKTDSKPVKEMLVHVLHVDDDEDFRVISKRLLEKQGSFQVEGADSVEQALQKVRQKPYDAIVSDYKMFGKTGLELFTEIRGNGNDAPFFLVTGEKREEIVKEALNLGVDRCFSKDRAFEVLFVELASGIKEAVKSKRSTVPKTG